MLKIQIKKKYIPIYKLKNEKKLPVEKWAIIILITNEMCQFGRQTGKHWAGGFCVSVKEAQSDVVIADDVMNHFL